MKTEILIYTRPEKSISDLKNTDHVGFIDYKGLKGYIACVNEGLDFRPLWIHSTESVCNCHAGSTNKQGLLAAVELAGSLHSLFQFDTRKELYKWLSED